MRRTPALSALAVAATLAAASMAMAGPAHAASTVHYVALGDSYSSGVGTDDATGSCDVSDQAYPQLYATATHPASFATAACSGAKTGDVISTQLGALSSTTTLVSITIGGNDVGFSSIVETCVLESTNSCVAAVNKAETYAKSTLPGLLNTTYNDIRARAPKAKVVVLGYPVFYDLSVSGCVGLSATDHQKIDEGIGQVDGVIQTSATSHSGFSYADVRSSFTGHQICDGGTKWLHALNYGDIDESYHPNDYGHADAYEPVFAKAAS